MFYPVDEIYGQLPTPTGNGTFLGWYTADGVQLTGEEIAEEDIWVTAKWDGEGAGEPDTDLDFSDWVNPYTDVAESDWYFAYVRELSARGVLGGYPDGTFRASAALTAGEALKLVLLGAGCQEAEPTLHEVEPGHVVRCFYPEKAVRKEHGE